MAHWSHVWLQNDVSPLTDALLWVCRAIGTFLICFVFNATTILLGESDDFHTPERPVTLSTAPSQFHLPAGMDLFSFCPAAGLKALIGFLSCLLVVGTLVRPLCAHVWSDAALFSHPLSVTENEDRRYTDDVKKERRSSQGSSPTGRMKDPTKKGVRGSALRREASQLDSDFAGRLTYFNFGPALGVGSPPVKLRRSDCVSVYVRRLRLEKIAQYVLCGLWVCLLLTYLSLLGVATGEWEAFRDSKVRTETESSNSWADEEREGRVRLCRRRPAVVLSEHSVSVLVFFVLETLWVLLQAISSAVLL
eukprot:Cvel_17433.t1-p1 / transcript=Cvel_17433.t1 / gene=Cvel_17433 / organism=Chromera_velia_CCMP2878 / gene_product=hypothetical protein / transcript_product=hypothetical protein / location=Cvel_scaffold1390:195-1111(-) / protein_length=305 / sequence_SO=supercontig / SO=protein_coding / is_pseudo=false